MPKKNKDRIEEILIDKIENATQEELKKAKLFLEALDETRQDEPEE